MSRNSSKIRSLKKKTSKASKSFSNLNSKNLVPRVGKHFHRDKQRKMKNYLYDNTNNYGSKIRGSNSIYNNRKTKKCFSLIGDSVRRFKHEKKESESQKLAGNRRRLRNLVRDKSLKLMQDYSNKNLTKKGPVQAKPTDEFNLVIEEKLRLLKTKLVHKSYEDSKKNHVLRTPVKDIISVIEEDTSDKLLNDFESSIPTAPFNSITMREVTPRFKQDSLGKSTLLKNSSILKKKSGNAFDSDYFESTGKKVIANESFSLGEFIRKFDSGNVFNNEDMQMDHGSLQVFSIQSVFVNKFGSIETVAKDPLLRLRVLGHLRKKYTQIMNN